MKFVMKNNGERVENLKCFINPTLRQIGRRYRSAIIICPGGGYSTLSETEADAVALRFQAYGFQAFVLNYTVNDKFPKAMYDLASAVSYIRENANKWDIDSNQIIGCGFSAGGHLVASLGCYSSHDIIKNNLTLNKPCNLNGMILCYPVISSGQWKHEQSILNLTNKNADLIKVVSLEKNVTKDVPPVFLWHCADDKVVNVQNTLIFAEALSKKNISFECHIFPKGGHGLALCDQCTAEVESQINPMCAKWFNMSVNWINELRKKNV